MTVSTGAPVGARRPGHHRADPERGAVTVEAALALLAMTVVLAAVVWGLGLLGAQLALGDAARAAARVAARADAPEAVILEARRLVPDAEVALRTDGERVLVVVRRVVRGPGLMARFGAVELVAAATAAEEPS